MSDPVRFIHLRVHTEYSLLEGAVPVKKLVGLCAAQNMPAVAVTDTNAMFAALEFSTIAAGAGVQPIVGCQFSLMHDPARLGGVVAAFDGRLKTGGEPADPNRQHQQKGDAPVMSGFPADLPCR